MEAPPGRGRITPLPPPEPYGSGQPVERAPRQWLPAVLGIAGLVAFALWLSGSGGSGTGGAETASPGPGRATLAPLSTANPASATTTTPPVVTTTTTLPPILTDLLPWLEGTLMLVSSTSDGDDLLIWDAATAAPLEFRLSGANIETFKPEPQALDRVAYETDGSVRALFAGGWREQEPVFVGTNGFAWDPAGTGTLMWVGTDQVTIETALYRMEPGGSIEVVSPMPPDTRMVEWTDFGLIMAEPQGPPVLVEDASGDISLIQPTLTVLRDQRGIVVAAAAAEPLRASIHGTVIAFGTELAFQASDIEIDDAWLVPPADFVVLDPPTDAGFQLRLVPINERLADGEPVFSADGRWSLSTDGSWVGRNVTRGDVNTLVVRSVVSDSVRVIPLQGVGPKITVGFSQNRWFFSWSPDSQELIVIGLTGARFAIPIDGNIRFGGAFIRQTS